MKKIYIVFGTTGEYSDQREWPVKAYLSEDKAQQHVLLAGTRAKELEGSRNGMDPCSGTYWWNAPEGQNEYDPHMQLDYTGTSYFLYNIDLEDDIGP